MDGTATAASARPVAAARRTRHNYARHHWAFVVPAAIVVLAVMVFPWVFTLYMSVQDWHVGGSRSWAGLANYAHLLHDERFPSSIWRTLYFTALSITAFSYYDIGYASAIVVVFFVLILAITLLLLRARQREAWQ